MGEVSNFVNSQVFKDNDQLKSNCIFCNEKTEVGSQWSGEVYFCESCIRDGRIGEILGDGITDILINNNLNKNLQYKVIEDIINKTLNKTWSNMAKNLIRIEDEKENIKSDNEEIANKLITILADENKIDEERLRGLLKSDKLLENLVENINLDNLIRESITEIEE